MPGPDAPDSLPAALARHAAAAPEQPWLFWPRGHDWAWMSWGEAARRVEGGEGLPYPASSFELSFANTLKAAARIAAALPPERDLGRSEREVVVFGGHPGERDDRAVFTWALLAGAAVVLEPEPSAVVPTAVWVRPTLFHGDTARLAALRRALEGQPEPLSSRLARLLRGRRAPSPAPPAAVRGPLGRLHTLVLTGSAPLSEDDRAFWRARGVTVFSLPA
jgi:hypothetical protein